MNRTKRAAAFATAAALALSALGATTAARADGPGFGVATITIVPTSGNVNTDVNFLDSIAVTTGGPVGSRTISGTYIFQSDVNLGPIAQVRDASTPLPYGTFGLDGAASFADRSAFGDNDYVSDRLLNATTTPLSSGTFELRYYWSGSPLVPDFATDPYSSLPMTYNTSTGAWSVLPPTVDTTLSLTAGASGSTVTLTATVKNLSGTATLTGAAGLVTFREGATVVASVPTSSGIAVATLPAVSDGTHTYVADFLADDFFLYFDSISGPATVTTPATTPDGNIDVDIPSNVGSLTLTGTTSVVNLGTAVLGGGTLNASGELFSTVTDTRQLEYPAWSLTGQVGDFTGTVGANTYTLDGKYLGWTPSILPSSTAGGSVAGSQVLPAPATTNGLKTSSVFATGLPNVTGEVTLVKAVLDLKAPRNTRAGVYQALLTITLV